MIRPLRIRYSLLIIFLSLAIFVAAIILRNPRYVSLKYYRSLISESQENKLSRNQFFYNAEIAFNKGNYEEAIEYLEKEIT